ncbi:hypothetical protein TASIC1_0019002800 [Trichoderma asperellum]|uniref:Uncharacterized protein n=1 Tax=Trichoderma asperellum TaxID=101201 RepID=A0A6V8R887_TRIAP|nr:hypothetical protein TASIC1_0019002800 [Trichoderma asperellum]
MNNGTTTFTQPAGPPGDMTYHITALPQFKSLRSCAQSGVASAILEQTNIYCATGPQALASCVCIKSGMSGRISSTLTSNVKWNCDNTATADVASALDVFELYCSAAEKEVVISVADTATETYLHPTNHDSARPSGPVETGSGSSGGGSGSGDSGGSNPTQGGKDGSSSSGNGGNKSSSVNKTAIIAACVLAAIVLIAAVGLVAFFVRRKRNRQMRGEALPPTTEGSNYQGPPELENTAKTPPNIAVVPELHIYHLATTHHGQNSKAVPNTSHLFHRNLEWDISRLTPLNLLFLLRRRINTGQDGSLGQLQKLMSWIRRHGKLPHDPVFE